MYKFQVASFSIYDCSVFCDYPILHVVLIDALLCDSPFQLSAVCYKQLNIVDLEI